MAGALYRIQAEHAPQLSASSTKAGIVKFVQKLKAFFFQRGFIYYNFSHLIL